MNYNKNDDESLIEQENLMCQISATIDEIIIKKQRK